MGGGGAAGSVKGLAVAETIAANPVMAGAHCMVLDAINGKDDVLAAAEA